MLKRKTPLKRGGPLKRSRLKPRNEERAAKRLAECFGEQAALCRRLECCVCGKVHAEYGRRLMSDDEGSFWLFRKDVSDPHHEPPRSIGGKDGDTVPLCRAHHDERHSIGRAAFERKHGVDLRAVAKAIREELARAPSCAQDEGEVV